MQPCNRIYYSKIYWRLSMFRAAYRSSSGAPNCNCSLWFIYCNKVKDFVYIRNLLPYCSILTRGCNYSLKPLMMSGIPLETWWAFN